jgi:replicative DNA helicase
VESDAIEHGKSVLAAIIRGPFDVLERALLRLNEDHFPDVQQKSLWRLIDFHYGHNGALLTRETLSATLRGAQSGESLFYEQYWDALCKRPEEPGSMVTWHTDQLLDIAAERRTGEALARGMEILRRGVEENGELVKGHAPARMAVVEALAEIDRSARNGSAPEGDVRAEYTEMLEDYNRRQDLAATKRHLIPTGLPTLDKLLGGGWNNGELNLVAGFTGSGKTSFCVQCAWYASVVCGKNVVILTSETLRPQIRIKILARHSLKATRQEFRTAYHGGLDSSLIKGGSLDAIGREYYGATVTDLTQNPAYGRIWVAQIPKGSTVASIETHLARLSRTFLADLVIVDYLQLLRADRKRQSKREELADIMQVAKEVAAGYADGRGVPILSPWQMSRDGFSKAQARDGSGGYYTLTDLAETNESGATADCVFTLLAPEMPGDKRRAVIRSRLAKNRDGDTSGVIELSADYATCRFEEAAAAARQDTGPSDPFGSVLGG